ncbi:MAG: Gfo/Idh/MocA family oxidoreductase [Verrucomicrobia bacterium]|nr:Gfo/Idh/MocA family oxidoreductase [Verrucomicrobiota bacterium]
MVGAGWFATTNHIPLLAAREDVELTAVCRLGAQELQRVQEHFGFRFATEDYRELLAYPLDAVVVASRHDLHFEHAGAALQRGLHVLCEKPMALHPGHAWQLVELARERGLHLLVPYGWHYKPLIRKTRSLMQEGLLGEIEYVLCYMASPTKSFFAGAGTVPEGWKPTVSAPEPGTWQDAKHGGGYGYGQLTHAMALLFWLTDLRAQSVICRMTNPDSHVDMYDSAIVHFTNNAFGSVSGAATLPDQHSFQIELRIFGKKGVLLFDTESGRERAVWSGHNGCRRQIDVRPGEGEYACTEPVHTFIDLIQGRGVNESPGDIAARSVELIDAMYRSAQTGGQEMTITMNDVYDS